MLLWTADIMNRKKSSLLENDKSSSSSPSLVVQNCSFKILAEVRRRRWPTMNAIFYSAPYLSIIQHHSTYILLDSSCRIKSSHFVHCGDPLICQKTHILYSISLHPMLFLYYIKSTMSYNNKYRVWY